MEAIEFDNFRFIYNIIWIRKLVLFFKKIKNNCISEHTALVGKQIMHLTIFVSKIQFDVQCGLKSTLSTFKLGMNIYIDMEQDKGLFVFLICLLELGNKQ